MSVARRPAEARPARKRGVLGRVTGAATERVVTAVDPDAILEHIDIQALLDRIDIDRLLDRVDPDRLLDRVDLGRLLDRVDLDRLLARADVDGLVRRVDLDAQVARIDLDRVLARVDLDQLVAGVDLDRVLARVDLDRLVTRLDLDAQVARLDLDRVLARVDLDRLVTRLDLDALLNRLDIESLVRRSGIADIVAESTGRFADTTLDVARRQLAGLDAVGGRMVDRVLRRPPDHSHLSPRQLAHEEEAEGQESSSVPGRTSVTGHYAGPVSRAISAVVDIGVISGSFTLGLAAVGVLARTLFGFSVGDRSSPWVLAGLLLWGFVYLFVCGVTAARTVGKGLVGLRLVRADGGVVTGGQVVTRTLLLPVCAAFAGLGFVPIVLGRRHRGVHDMVAGTAVVYDWGDRPAELPAPLSAYLDRHRVQD